MNEKCVHTEQDTNGLDFFPLDFNLKIMQATKYPFDSVEMTETCDWQNS